MSFRLLAKREGRSGGGAGRWDNNGSILVRRPGEGRAVERAVRAGVLARFG